MSLINKGLNVKRLMEACHNSAALAARKLTDLINLKEEDPMRLAVEDFSIKELWESVDVTQFPILTATLVEKKVMEAFEAAKKIGDRLVTPMPSNLQISRVPGATVKGELHDIEPGMPYEHDGDIAEKYVQIEGKKRGAILDITMEAIKFDQTGLILLRAAKFGERAAIDRERRIIFTIADVTVGVVNHFAWYPFDTTTGAVLRTALWSAAVPASMHLQNNIITNALQDWTDIDAAYTLLGQMLDDNGEPILNNPMIILTPVALETQSIRLVRSTTIPARWTGGALVNSPGEANPWSNRFEPLSSPLLDLLSTRTWYLGDFKKQFIEKIVIPLEVLTRPIANTDDEFERDIAAQYKVRHYTQVGALDYRYCVRSCGTYGVCPDDSYCHTWA